MKREDLVKLGVAEELIDQIMVLHGKDIEKHKTATETAKAELDGIKAQLTEANTTIEGFKKLDIEGVKKSADEWKAKAEKAQADAAAQVTQIKFDHALTQALVGAKAKNATAVRALLKLDDLKLTADGSIVGLEDQIKKVREANDFLFEAEGATPKIVAGTSSPPMLEDSFTTALRLGAGLPSKKG